jgi:hypothetical protein
VTRKSRRKPLKTLKMDSEMAGLRRASARRRKQQPPRTAERANRGRIARMTPRRVGSYLEDGAGVRPEGRRGVTAKQPPLFWRCGWAEKGCLILLRQKLTMGANSRKRAPVLIRLLAIPGGSVKDARLHNCLTSAAFAQFCARLAEGSLWGARRAEAFGIPSERRARADQGDGVRAPGPRRTRKEDREWRMTFALAGVAAGLFVLVAIELVMRYL